MRIARSARSLNASSTERTIAYATRTGKPSSRAHYRKSVASDNRSYRSSTVPESGQSKSPSGCAANRSGISGKRTGFGGTAVLGISLQHVGNGLLRNVQCLGDLLLCLAFGRHCNDQPVALCIQFSAVLSDCGSGAKLARNLLLANPNECANWLPPRSQKRGEPRCADAPSTAMMSL
jgi:hypothetical protein